MATIKPVWTENVALHASAALATGASVEDDIDLDDLGADVVAITIEIIFGSTPDGNVLVEIFNSSDSGVNNDTEPLVSGTIPEATSATKRKSFIVTDVPYLAVKVTNNDTADNVTYEGWFAWRNWNST